MTFSCGHLSTRAWLALQPGLTPGQLFHTCHWQLWFLGFRAVAASHSCSSYCAASREPRAKSWCRGLRREGLGDAFVAAPGRPAGSSIGGCVSDFALAPLRGLDVQTSPERAEREGPARGRRRQEAPPLKGAGRAPPLGRTRGRKEGEGLPAGPGCERPQGGQPRAGAQAVLRSRQVGSGRWPPEPGPAGRPAPQWQPQPPYEGRGRRKRKPAVPWTLRPGGEAGGGGGRGLTAPRACGPRTPPELRGASLKAAPAPLFSPFLLHCRSGKNVGAGRG